MYEYDEVVPRFPIRVLWFVAKGGVVACIFATLAWGTSTSSSRLPLHTSRPLSYNAMRL